jgi:hypothetical protein
MLAAVPVLQRDFDGTAGAFSGEFEGASASTRVIP